MDKTSASDSLLSQNWMRFISSHELLEQGVKKGYSWPTPSVLFLHFASVYSPWRIHVSDQVAYVDKSAVYYSNVSSG